MVVERKQYTVEFKREAVRLMTQGDLSAAQVARDLGINPNLLGKWKRQLEAGQQAQGAGRDGYVAFPGQGHAHDAEVSRLRRENAVLRMERDVLKKAIGIFVEPKR
jgi:transposase